MSGARDPADWVGHRIVRKEIITDRMVEHFRVTLTGTRGPLEVPAGFHWCLAPDAVEPQDFGRDGHPARASSCPNCRCRAACGPEGRLSGRVALRPERRSNVYRRSAM